VILIRLYPRGWRERYEAEMRVVLAEHRGGFRTKVSLLMGAFDAQLHRSTFGQSSGPNRTHTLWLSVIPSLFLIVQFLLGLDRGSSPDLVNSMGTLAMIAAVVICVWSGYSTGLVSGTTQSSVIAGGITAVMAFGVAWLVGIGLTLLEVSGFAGWVMSLHGGSGSFGLTLASVVQNIFNLYNLALGAGLAFGALVGGGILGALGMSLRSIRLAVRGLPASR
jgi:hypothetical protein